MKNPLYALLATIACLAPSGVMASDKQYSWPVRIQNDLIRLGHIEWKFKRNFASICPQTAFSTGMALDFIGAYDEADRSFVKQNAELGDHPQVILVPNGSPAEKAGIQPGDQIWRVDGTSPYDFVKRKSDFGNLSEIVLRQIGKSAKAGRVRIDLLRNDEIVRSVVFLEKVCSASIFLKTTKSISAYSDGTNVAITSGLLTFSRNDDEIALVVGHEFAHVILHQNDRSGLFGKRRIEDEADLMGANLAYCLGFDVTKSLNFWDRFQTRDRLGFLRIPTHRAPRARAKRIKEAKEEFVCPVSFNQPQAP